MPLPERPESGAFLAAVTRDLRRDAESLVPWFLHNMPDYYFRTHGPDEQARHIRAIISGRVLSGGQSATLWNPARTRVTRIAPNGAPSLLEHLRELTAANIRTSRLYATLDGRLRLDTFLLEPQPPVGAGSRALREAMAKLSSRVEALRAAEDTKALERLTAEILEIMQAKLRGGGF